jgi:hypothetical protein
LKYTAAPPPSVPTTTTASRAGVAYRRENRDRIGAGSSAAPASLMLNLLYVATLPKVSRRSSIHRDGAAPGRHRRNTLQFSIVALGAHRAKRVTRVMADVLRLDQ